MKRFIILLLAISMLFALFACGKDEPVDTKVDIDPVDEYVEPQPEYFSPITGEAIDEKTAYTRPVALMINNLKKATPQSGIIDADIFFEIPAEGGINRILAVFQNYGDIKEIGTVRSARPYFVDWAVPLDAIFIHYGGSPPFYTLKKAKKFDECDGINGTVDNALFWRDAERKKTAGFEHSVMTSGEKLTNGLVSLGFRTTVDEPYEPYFNFYDKFISSGDKTASNVTLKFSNYATVQFEYDSSRQKYLRSQYGEAHTDKISSEQLAVTNVIHLKTSVSLISGDDAGRLNVVTTGSGSGTYISGGLAKDITWSKADMYSPLKLYNTDGSELVINTGKTWVMINNTNIVTE